MKTKKKPAVTHVVTSRFYNPVPDVLRVRPDGTIYCADGRSVKKYLRDWIAFAKHKADVPIVICHREGFKQLQSDAFLGRNMAS